MPCNHDGDFWQNEPKVPHHNGVGSEKKCKTLGLTVPSAMLAIADEVIGSKK